LKLLDFRAPPSEAQYGLIAADPPWTFKTFSSKGLKKSAQSQYACMTPQQIYDFPVRELAAPDCWLLLWTSAPLLETAFGVIGAWGFAYKSCLAWRKVTINGKPRMGCGYIVRMRTS
jgi:N6-adenosine-specific RNA methylase IME4